MHIPKAWIMRIILLKKSDKIQIIGTHRLNRWFFICGQSPIYYWLRLKAYPTTTKCKRLLLVTRKRVYIFFERHLVVYHILFQLILYVFCYLFSVLTCRIDIVSSTPKASVPILILRISMTLKDDKCALSL